MFLYTSQVLLIGQSTNITLGKSKPSLRSTNWSSQFKAELCNIPFILLIPNSILILHSLLFAPGFMEVVHSSKEKYHISGIRCSTKVHTIHSFWFLRVAVDLLN